MSPGTSSSSSPDLCLHSVLLHRWMHGWRSRPCALMDPCELWACIWEGWGSLMKKGRKDASAETARWISTVGQFSSEWEGSFKIFQRTNKKCLYAEQHSGYRFSVASKINLKKILSLQSVPIFTIIKELLCVCLTLRGIIIQFQT